MTQTELLLYAFMNECYPLQHLLQSDKYKLIDVTDRKVTLSIDKDYFTDHQAYMDFMFDLDETQLVYQLTEMHGNYFIRLYL